MAFSARAIHQNPAVQAVSPGSLARKLGFHYGWIIVANPMCKFYHASNLSNWSGGFPCSWLRLKASVWLSTLRSNRACRCQMFLARTCLI